MLQPMSTTRRVTRGLLNSITGLEYGMLKCWLGLGWDGGGGEGGCIKGWRKIAKSRLFGVCVALSSIIGLTHAQATPDFQVSYVDPHNNAREALGVSIPDLTWDTTLEDYATNWANTRAGSDCPLTHSGGPYGENIYCSSAPSSPEAAVALWVDEKQYYHYDTNTCDPGEVCGHYTQVVWRDTEAVGCGSANCADGSMFVVCSYNPPGNVLGQSPY